MSSRHRSPKRPCAPRRDLVPPRSGGGPAERARRAVRSIQVLFQYCATLLDYRREHSHRLMGESMAVDP
ncbi:hypothetical protein [Streptomyces sp. NPDC059247]|uniref:hypothetical protein n=1 Tax=Streptomyces sp. NPDC059247 TaxID=3346790 RepID=UPI00369FFEB4